MKIVAIGGFCLVPASHADATTDFMAEAHLADQ